MIIISIGDFSTTLTSLAQQRQVLSQFKQYCQDFFFFLKNKTVSAFFKALFPFFFFNFNKFYSRVTDKQQELDLPTLRIEDSQGADPRVAGASSKKKEKGGAPGRTVPMSHISGVKRPLTHTNSFTGEKLPKHGVETAFEDELGKVSLVQLRFSCVCIGTLRTLLRMQMFFPQCGGHTTLEMTLFQRTSPAP